MWAAELVPLLERDETRVLEGRTLLAELEKKPPAHVTYWSTVRVGGRIYSVPSRLIGHDVEVRQHPDTVEVFYAGQLVETMPRIRGEKPARIDYRHVIWSLKLEELSRGDWVEEAANVLAFGLPGVGKSHAAAALGHALIERGHSVLFTPTFRLVQELLAAKRDLELPRALRKLDVFDLVVLDDIGYVQQAPEEIEVLFALMAERYERRSILITSNALLILLAGTGSISARILSALFTEG